jgi:hypothetical protein
VESEGSRRQNSGLRNTNLIKAEDSWVSLLIKTKPLLPKAIRVFEAGGWSARRCEYLGRSANTPIKLARLRIPEIKLELAEVSRRHSTEKKIGKA